MIIRDGEVFRINRGGTVLTDEATAGTWTNYCVLFGIRNLPRNTGTHHAGYLHTMEKLV